MNINNNPLDNFLHDSVEDAQFPFKEEYWDKMSILLDQEEKNKKRPFFWRWFGILSALLIVGLTTFLYPKLHRSSSKENNTSTQNLVSVTTEKSYESDVVVPKQTATENNNANQTTTNSATQTNQVEKEEIMATSPLKNNVDFTSSNENKANEEKNSFQNSKQTTNNAHKIVKNNEVENNADIENSNSENSNHSSISSIINHVIIPNKKQNKKPIRITKQASTKKSNEVVNAKYGTSISSTNEKINTLETTTNKAVKNNVVMVNGKPMLPVDTQSYSVKEIRDDSKYNPRYIASLKNYVAEKFDSVTILTFKPIAQKVEEPNITNSKKSSKKDKEIFIPEPMNFFVSIAANANKGFKGNTSNQIKWGISPNVGIGIEKKISNKITLATQVGFTYFNGLNLQKTVSGNQFSFGLDSSSTSVYYKKMYQACLPISLYYQILKNHFLMASFGASYMFDVSSKYEETKLISNGTTNSFGVANKVINTTSKNNQMGYRTGFNQFDLFFQVGYSFQVFKNTMLQFGFQQGLFDMTKNTFFSNTIKNTQTRFSIGIKYSFKRNNY